MFEIIVMIILGNLFGFMGWRIWKKEQIHDYHYTKVAETDKKPYTEKMGKAMIIMGTGMFLTGVIDFVFSTAYGWIAFGICFAAGLIIMFLAQIKYNHGIF